MLVKSKKAILIIEGKSTKKLKKFNFFTVLDTENCNFNTILDSFLEEISNLKPKLISLNKVGHFILEIEDNLVKGDIIISRREHYTKAWGGCPLIFYLKEVVKNNEYKKQGGDKIDRNRISTISLDKIWRAFKNSLWRIWKI